MLRDISARFGGKLALNSAVEHPGTVSLGDRAELLAPSAGKLTRPIPYDPPP